MPKFNQPIVELSKIINQTPFDTLWVYWETDLTFDITGSSSQILVRTHDKILSGSSASLIISSQSRIPLPVGTYSIGTYSNPYPVPGYDEFIIVSSTAGWVSGVLNGTTSISHSQEVNVPNSNEEYFEWVASEEVLVPLFRDDAPGEFVIGASYSDLTIRTSNT